ncbi:hypothetical protein NL676_033857 [Syzygium grande]|nr:hypothetical protein NL676_033857 [Syzygium grande]
MSWGRKWTDAWRPTSAVHWGSEVSGGVRLAEGRIEGDSSRSRSCVFCDAKRTTQFTVDLSLSICNNGRRTGRFKTREKGEVGTGQASLREFKKPDRFCLIDAMDLFSDDQSRNVLLGIVQVFSALHACVDAGELRYGPVVEVIPDSDTRIG